MILRIFFLSPSFRLAFLLSGLLLELAGGEELRSTTPDGKISVVFPISLAEGESREKEHKTIVGKAFTRMITQSEGDASFTITETEFPPLVAALFGEKASLEKAKGAIMAGKNTTERKFYRYEEIEKPIVMVLQSDSVNPNEEEHPGYDGFTVMVRLKNKLYLINSTFSKEVGQEAQDLYEKARKALLESIEIAE
ncbi:MAG: hypothetical protein AAGC68_08025 [Verrucomicrobiota bacterium]